MCGCAACSWPLAFQDRHTRAFSCAIPINTTRPSPPSRSAASSNGRAVCSLFSPLANRRTGIPFFMAHRYTSATYPSPILPNAADDGVENPSTSTETDTPRPHTAASAHTPDQRVAACVGEAGRGECIDEQLADRGGG